MRCGHCALTYLDGIPEPQISVKSESHTFYMSKPTIKHYSENKQSTNQTYFSRWDRENCKPKL